MKFPKTIIIAGRTWKISINKKDRGGWFNSDKGTILIGTKSYTKEETMQVFIHEVLEAVMSNNLLRYKLPYVKNDNGNYMFVFNHKEFEKVVTDFYLAIKEILKK